MKLWYDNEDGSTCMADVFVKINYVAYETKWDLPLVGNSVVDW